MAPTTRDLVGARFHTTKSIATKAIGGYRVESDAKWRIAYARANVGLMFPGPISQTKWFGDVGAASVVFSRIDAEPTGDYDDSNLGEPAGIATDGPYDINSMGRGDFGVYARLGIQYVFE